MLSTLTQRASLLACTLTPDGGGGFTQSWDAFGEAWVALTPQDARDVFDTGGLEVRARHRIVLRRRGDLAAGQRVQIGARLFRVHGVLDPGPRALYVTLLCEELP